MQNILTLLKDFGNLIVSQFGFENVTEFMNSMIHTKMLFLTLPSSVLLYGLVTEWLGISSAVFISFGVMAVLELVTGLWGSLSMGKKWSSRKFSRFGLKILVWLCLIMVANSFKTSYENLDGLQNYLTFQLFTWLHGTFVIYITLEYMISILENWGKITGKPQSKLLVFLQSKLDKVLEISDDMTSKEVIDESYEGKNSSVIKDNDPSGV